MALMPALDEVLEQQARAALAKGFWERACETISQSLDLGETVPRLILSANCLVELNLYEQALAQAEKACQLDPKSAEVHETYASVCYALALQGGPLRHTWMLRSAEHFSISQDKATFQDKDPSLQQQQHSHLPHVQCYQLLRKHVASWEDLDEQGRQKEIASMIWVLQAMSPTSSRQRHSWQHKKGPKQCHVEQGVWPLRACTKEQLAYHQQSLRRGLRGKSNDADCASLRQDRGRGSSSQGFSAFVELGDDKGIHVASLQTVVLILAANAYYLARILHERVAPDPDSSSGYILLPALIAGMCAGVACLLALLAQIRATQGFNVVWSAIMILMPMMRLASVQTVSHASLVSFAIYRPEHAFTASLISFAVGVVHCTIRMHSVLKVLLGLWVMGALTVGVSLVISARGAAVYADELRLRCGMILLPFVLGVAIMLPQISGPQPSYLAVLKRWAAMGSRVLRCQPLPASVLLEDCEFGLQLPPGRQHPAMPSVPGVELRYFRDEVGQVTRWDR
uniref:Uncharacterized protein n=1 Tax=Haptolina ericina TaxID=156174 RepID=A0A7S3BRI4_9EUKA|mmetsp:Transcript_65742/g.146723  ORF Transcript_65742/g.146723 Transcript_65742/m.146723 type:complete len:511 (+) Transcript_65742:78-1610(+)